MHGSHHQTEQVITNTIKRDIKDVLQVLQENKKTEKNNQIKLEKEKQLEEYQKNMKQKLLLQMQVVAELVKKVLWEQEDKNEDLKKLQKVCEKMKMRNTILKIFMLKKREKTKCSKGISQQFLILMMF